MNTKRLLTIAVTLISCISAYALSLAEYPLLPVPQAIQFGKSTVYVKSASLSMPYWTEDWNNILAENGVTLSPKSKYSINGELVNEIPGAPTGNDEAYSLTISKKGISVKATSEKGIYWALQTLRQLFATSHNNSLPECEIVDYPAFYWRGFMNDTGRSYISLEELKREINII